jgi:hypothetical protein
MDTGACAQGDDHADAQLRAVASGLHGAYSGATVGRPTHGLSLTDPQAHW